VIPDPSLSKRHCVLVKTDGLLVIRDWATTNGTKVKGQRIRWAALLPEDRVSLGAYKLRIYLGSDEMPSPSELWQARGALAAPPKAGAAGSAPAASRASKKTQPARASHSPDLAALEFPEPSLEEAPPDWEIDSAEPVYAEGGLEIMDEEPAPQEFEIVADDADQVIELE
jgi:predicted component of type VI protein secretion system